ncbi:plasmid mobilization protein [Plantibacter sp. CFBP 13570]|uniref:plasmid mobilization protein n=1 Tax=Plantibacter sp. CFBP 13570 TaxID=2775272 RepID=UPI001930BD65|nr:plasmid mobilization relaxosome protein MobC [Plantibacter sp. CFBP 13570]MBD8535699.1 plasmid mobilization relaxosome protein MobC [Plantibacter sp. CFBP 13570]
MTDETEPRKRALVRRRRANAPVARQHSHRVKVTPEEEARLVVLAEEQRVTVARLLVESTLQRGGETSTQRRDLLTQFFQTQRMLGALSNNVNQLARASNATGVVSAELAATLRATQKTLTRMDDLVESLIHA